MSVTIEDNTNEFMQKLESGVRLALEFSVEQIKSEVQRIRPPQVITGFFRASMYADGQTLTITGEGKNRVATVSGKAKIKKRADIYTARLIEGADYGVWLEFKPFTHVGVLAPMRKGAANAVPAINKIFEKFLTI
jgi:hypothetical protein